MGEFVNIYDAKTHLSGLVDRAAAGEEIVIARNGKPVARLVPLPKIQGPREPAHALGLTRLDEDFDDPLPAEILSGFDGHA